MAEMSADLRQLAADMAHASGQGIEQVSTQLVRAAAFQTQQIEQATAPQRSGALVASIQVNFPDPLTAVVGPTVPYAAYVVDGTKPHLIRPKRGGFLVFTVNGRTVYAKVVHHPGTRPNPFPQQALEHAVDQLAAQAGQKAADLILKGAS